MFVHSVLQRFFERLPLLFYEGNAFAFTGNVEEDLLSIMSEHPMLEEGAKELLRKSNSDRRIVEKLLNEGKLIELEYKDHRYYVRKNPSRNGSLNDSKHITKIQCSSPVCWDTFVKVSFQHQRSYVVTDILCYEWTLYFQEKEDFLV
jgi:hypothetical protein